MVAKALSVLVLLLLVPVFAFAQATSLPVDLPTDEALSLLIKSLGGLKGAGALAIAVVVVQGVLFFFRTKLSTFAGKWRLLIIGGLNLVVVFLTLVSLGIPLTTALVHTETATAFQVLIHQIIKQVSEKTEVPVPAPTPPVV